VLQTFPQFKEREKRNAVVRTLKVFTPRKPPYRISLVVNVNRFQPVPSVLKFKTVYGDSGTYKE
jgi:hypothetical protein